MEQWPADHVERWPLERLIPSARNARTHTPEQIEQVAASMREWGWTIPVLVDEQGNIIAGHCRVKAGAANGYTEAPVMVARGWSDSKKRAYALADNKLALNAGWDGAILAAELNDLKALAYDLSLTGFGAGELESLLDPAADPAADVCPEVPELAVTEPGDVWRLGKHRVLCGDSTAAATTARLFEEIRPALCFTDPPYGIGIVKPDGPFGGRGTVGRGGTPGAMYPVGGVKNGNGNRRNIKPRQYPRIVNDNSTTTAAAFYRTVGAAGVRNLVIFGGNYFTDFLPPSPCWIVWDKRNTGYFADVELAWTSFSGGAKLYSYLWNGLARAGDRRTELATRVHPTQKPVGLIVEIFADFPGEVCYDGFLGSGSTLIACEKTGRVCLGMELSAAYCDVIVERWETYTGKAAVLESTGQTFEQARFGRLLGAEDRVKEEVLCAAESRRGRT